MGIAISLSMRNVPLQHWNQFGANLAPRPDDDSPITVHAAVTAAVESMGLGSALPSNMTDQPEFGLFTDRKVCAELTTVCVLEYKRVPAWIITLSSPALCDSPGPGNGLFGFVLSEEDCDQYVVIDAKSGTLIESWGGVG